MTQEILVLSPFGGDFGLISKAYQLAAPLGWPVRVLLGCQEEREPAARAGAKNIHLLELPQDFADDSQLAAWLAERIETQWKSAVILAPATIRMRAVMPELAFRLGAGLTADCTALELTAAGELLQTRPAFGNSLMAQIKTTSPIQMATVRPGTFAPADQPVEAVVCRETWENGPGKVVQTAFEPFEDTCPLTQAEIIVAGGAGIGTAEDFALLARFAKQIGAGIAASRCAVDLGLAPYACQVGMTGVTVHPKLYIAVGISGAVQHLAGMSGSGKIIAINSDPKAPIFDYADYGVVGDWKKVIEEFPGLSHSPTVTQEEGFDTDTP